MPNKPHFTCPVCGFDGLTEPPYDATGTASFDLCPSCGVEFGYDDSSRSFEELRQRWLDRGATWWSKHTPPPIGWDARQQLIRLGQRK